ncbi:TPA: choline dehydrogenase [Pseudomonas putida]|jgi:choline dehydrogenase|uniref:Choline dehydrogenase n=1 Tax=Pseudomonas putida (strain GB-1) TaxID=76869 RepID=B0KGJ0_PSEPG|nr:MULTISPECIES: choline dehydrogenase [Pseudomonas]ABY98991.1 choline dehydrogenase [Pseudomonas putida GB-1]APE99229.1 choline dehydrogenase [Pseudomonas putida]MBP0708801.1 choline dehydrogenase [Pseudomonas sp. T34]MCE1001025.1 choline dehydrogenase [Pseudomonas sp. NMI1173_11]MCK2188239.1 choline dehydrogenase [Pseudomonas sp. MB04B]
MTKRYDYIIIGAGSAGCVLANRLSEDAGTSVLVLEFGGSDRSVLIQMPSAFSLPMNTKKYNWHYETVAEPHLDNRRLHCPRGKVLGGSSSINGLVYIRGHACDFDEWESLGAKNWSYRNCLPYFKRAEQYKFGGDDYRGGAGPLSTNNGNNMQNPLYGAWVEAGAEAGYIKTDDCNGYMQEGFGAMHMTVKDGVRWSTANAYLRPAMTRPNLTVITHAMTRRILLDGKRAVGVEYDHGGQTHKVMCNREVLVASGPIGSPHLLQRSGIGPAAVLKSAGIEVRHDLPGVGENLQDHSEIYIQYACKQPVTLNGKMNLLGKAMIGLRWLLFKDGLGASNHFEAGGFIRSSKGLRWPDIQFHFLPAAMRYDGDKPFKGHGFMVLTGPNKPKSRGHVRALSADPYQHPQIRFNYLESEEDREGFRRCVRLTREIIAQPAMDRYRGEELAPGPQVQTDEEIDAFVRANMESTMHPCGSCRMGEDEMAVVDSMLRVRGLQGLRVIDSSVFPSEPNGNLNAPTIMLAERAADLVRGRQPLAPVDVPVGLVGGWEEEQRSRKPVREMPIR